MATLPVTLINFPTIAQGNRGVLTFIEGDTHIPFDIKRVFYVYDVRDYFTVRGQHIHKECHQVIIAVADCVNIEVDGEKYFLDSPSKGLYIPPGVSVSISGFYRQTVLLVLCSHHFSEEDYVRVTES